MTDSLTQFFPIQLSVPLLSPQRDNGPARTTTDIDSNDERVLKTLGYRVLRKSRLFMATHICKKTNGRLMMRTELLHAEKKFILLRGYFLR